jgi:hypothetical protein
LASPAESGSEKESEQTSEPADSHSESSPDRDSELSPEPGVSQAEFTQRQKDGRRPEEGKFLAHTARSRFSFFPTENQSFSGWVKGQDESGRADPGLESGTSREEQVPPEPSQLVSVTEPGREPEEIGGKES